MESDTTVVALPSWTCKRCGHSWFPRIATKPKQCPSCRSPYWDTPRKKPKKEPK